MSEGKIVTSEHFEMLSMLLVNAYSALDEYEPADEVLEDPTSRLHDILPKVSSPLLIP